MRNLSCLSLLVKYFHLCLRDISLKNPCEENGFFKVCYYIYEWCLDNVIFVWLHLWMMSVQCHFCLIVFVITFMNDIWTMSFLLDCVCYYIYEWYLDNVIFVWLCSLLHLWMISGQCHFCLIVFVIAFMNDVGCTI